MSACSETNLGYLTEERVTPEITEAASLLKLRSVTWNELLPFLGHLVFPSQKCIHLDFSGLREVGAADLRESRLIQWMLVAHPPYKAPNQVLARDPEMPGLALHPGGV